MADLISLLISGAEFYRDMQEFNTEKSIMSIQVFQETGQLENVLVI